MATVLNTTPQTQDASNGLGFMLGIILLIVFALLFFFYALPLITSGLRSTAPQINVPGKVDVNVHSK